MATVQVRHGGVWKQPTALQVNHAGTWKAPTGAWVKSGGTWQQFWPTGDPTRTLNLDFTTGTLDPKITFARTGTATYIGSDGLLKTAATGVARFDYEPVTLVPRGLLLTEARTNNVIQNRTLTNAAWTKTSCTAVKDQVGADGTANGASKLTATGANATCLQSITAVSALRSQSAFVKRITGSGAVQMTMDNGATWTAVTVTAAWTRVSIPAQTFTNPRVGFRLVTSGDVIAVDYVQNEVGPFPTAPIATTTAAVTRNGDSASMTGTNFSSWYNQAEGTFVMDVAIRSAAPGRIFIVQGPTDSELIEIWQNDTYPSGYFSYRGWDDNLQSWLIHHDYYTQNTRVKFAAAYKLNDCAFCHNGGTVNTISPATMPTVTQLIFREYAGAAGTAGELCVARLSYYNVRKTNAELQALTA